MTTDALIGWLVLAAVGGWSLWRIHGRRKASQLRRRLEGVGADDVEPKVLAVALFGILLTNRFGLDSKTVEQCVSGVSNLKRADSLYGPMIAYLCLLFRDEMVSAYGKETSDDAWNLFYGELEALASLDEEGQVIAQTTAYWIQQLGAGASVSSDLGPERMEAFEFSSDMCLAAGVSLGHRDSDSDVPWSADSTRWFQELEEVGEAFARVRAATGESVRTAVRLVGLDEWNERLASGLEDRLIPNKRVTSKEERDGS